MKNATNELVCRSMLTVFVYGLMTLIGAPYWAGLIGALIYAQLALPPGFSDRGES